MSRVSAPDAEREKRAPPHEKLRRLQAVSSAAGVFRILAADHRGVLLKMMDQRGDGSVSADRVSGLKLDIVRQVSPYATAVILDAQYGVRQAVGASAIPSGVGLLTTLGSDLRAGSVPLPDAKWESWSVEQAHDVGASGVKLYLSYHPDAGDRAKEQEEVVRQVAERCARAGMPLFLEAVACSIDPGAPVGSAGFARERRRVVVRTAERLGALGPDVLKLPFPVDGDHERSPSAWSAACNELNDASPVPWTLLSAGDPFDRFSTQLQIACESGCSGFIAGRTVWSEAAIAPDSERARVLVDTILPRMQELSRIADRYGHDWREKHPSAASAPRAPLNPHSLLEPFPSER